MKKWLILWLMLGSSLAWGQMSRVRPPVKLNCSSNMPTVGRTIGELCSNSGTGELMYWNGVAWVVIGASAGGADVGIAFPHLYCDGSGTTDDPWTSTDCTAGIELAIEALGANGGIVQLVPGYYQTCDVVNIKSNITLQGFGIDKSIIRRQALTVTSALEYPHAQGIKFGPTHLGWWDWRTLGQTGENIVLQDFTFDGNGQNQDITQTYDYDLNDDGTVDTPFNYPIGIGMINKIGTPSEDRLGGLDNVRISRIKVINTLENNLDIRSAKNVIVEDSEFYDCGVNPNYDSPQCNGINIGCVDDYDLTNDGTYDGVDNTHAAGWCNHTILRGNKIARMDDQLPNAHGECIAVQNQSNILIQGNDLSKCDAGIEQGGDTITIKNIRIVDNTIHDLDGTNKLLAPYDSDWDGTIETGEYIATGKTGIGFVAFNDGNAINMVISNNTFENLKDEGIHIYYVEGLVISNNTFTDVAQEVASPLVWEGHKDAIEVIPRKWESVIGTGGNGGCVISGNHIQMGGGGLTARAPYPYGIILQYATDCEIIGNTITGFTNDTLADTAISIGASSNRIQVIGNTISGTYAVAYNIVGESPFDLDDDGTIAPGEVMDGAEDVTVRQNHAYGYVSLAYNNGTNSHVEDLELNTAYTTQNFMEWDFLYDSTVDIVFGVYGLYGQNTDAFGLLNKGRVRLIADYDNDATGDDTDAQHNIYFDTEGDGTFEWYMTDTKLDFLKNSTARVAATLGGSSGRLNLLSNAGMTISADNDASGNELLELVGNVDANKRITFGACNVTAASTTVIDDCNHTSITGTTTVTNISTCDSANNGRILVIRCSSDATPFTDGGNLKLAGDFTCTADDALTLICDGSNWTEIARSAN